MISRTFGKFKIISYLGGGRFGDVYLAKDTLLDTKVALKVARSNVSDNSSFLREIKILFSLEHPFILRYYSGDVIEGKLVLITEYVKGHNLRVQMERGCPTNPIFAKRILMQIAMAIDYAHSQNVIHRDLKPENIMLDKDENVKLTDFGLSKFLEKDLSHSIGGTPPYMSPESWEGRIHRNSDQWSLAAIAVELLTAINPFFAENLEDIRNKIFAPPEPRYYFPYRIPGTAEEAFSRVFSQDPEKRFSTCTEFIEKVFKYIVRKKKTKQKSTESTVLPQLSFFDSPSHEFPSLSREQQKAINSLKRKILVLGGAGTGKTHTLVAKVYELVVSKKVDPMNIFVSTYTVRGWQDLEGRLQKYLKAKTKDLWIGNFHRHCNQILSSHPERLGYREGFEMIPPAFALQKIREIEEENDSRGYFSPSEIRYEIAKLKQKFMSLNDFIPENNHDEYLKFIWEKYQERLLSENIMDYTDILVNTYKLLKEYQDIGQKYMNLFKYILIDDFQDFVSDKAIIEILKLFSSGRNFLFCTGDDDQRIYEWKNQNGDCAERMEKSIEGFVTHKLTRTFRLPPEILNPALNLISTNEDRIKKVIWTRKKPENGFFSINSFPTPTDEAAFIASSIERFVDKEGEKWKDFAVLSRFRRQLKVLREAFVRMKIPFSFVEADNFFEKEEIELLVRYMNAISNKRAKEDFKFILERVLLDKEEAKDFMDELYQRKESISTLTALRLGIEKLGLLNTKDSKTSNSSLNKTGEVSSFLEIVEDFEKVAQDKTPKAFIQYLRIFKDSGLKKEEEAVKLLTIHQAKGLEFPTVYMFGLAEREFPSARSLLEKRSLEGERRLFYVGMTRASKRLFLTYSKYRSLSKSHLNRPSRFLREIIGA